MTTSDAGEVALEVRDAALPADAPRAPAQASLAVTVLVSALVPPEPARSVGTAPISEGRPPSAGTVQSRPRWTKATLRPSGEIFRHRFRRQRPARGLQHRAADALNETSENQLQHRLGKAAE